MSRPIRPSIIDRDAFERVAACLYGTPLPINWQLTLARQLPGLNGREHLDDGTVKELGKRLPIHAGHVRSLLALIDERGEHLAGVGDELAAALRAAGEPIGLAERGDRG